MVIKQKYLIEFQIYYLLIVESLIDLLHFPSLIRYFLDINCIFLILLFFPKVKNLVNDKSSKKLSAYIFFYMVATIAFSIIRRTPIGQVAWAARNNYLFIFFFFICAYSLNLDDVKRIMKNTVRLQAYNILCAVYEYFIIRKTGDNLGGMFGTAQGCNGYINVYLCIITAYSIIQYVNKKASLAYLSYIVLSSIVLAVASELKFYFIELAIIIIVSSVLTNINPKNGMMVIVGVMALFVGFQILTALDPTSAELLHDFDRISEYSKVTYDNKVIARATPFSQINDYFFRGNVFYNLFGYGFGACESSETFAWANSSFATAYGQLGYRNLSTAMLFIETGYVGIVAFIAILVGIFVNAQKLKQKNIQNRSFYAFSQVVSVILIANVWYNSSIRREIAYLSFFCLSTYIICEADKKKREKEELQENQSTEKKSYFKNKNKRALG